MAGQILEMFCKRHSVNDVDVMSAQKHQQSSGSRKRGRKGFQGTGMACSKLLDSIAYDTLGLIHLHLGGITGGLREIGIQI